MYCRFAIGHVFFEYGLVKPALDRWAIDQREQQKMQMPFGPRRLPPPPPQDTALEARTAVGIIQLAALFSCHGLGLVAVMSVRNVARAFSRNRKERLSEREDEEIPLVEEDSAERVGE